MSLHCGRIHVASMSEDCERRLGFWRLGFWRLGLLKIFWGTNLILKDDDGRMYRNNVDNFHKIDIGPNFELILISMYIFVEYQ